MAPGAISTLYVDFRAGIASLDSDMQAISRTLAKSGRDFEKLGKSLTQAFTLPIVGAAAEVFKAADSYQKAFRTIQVQTGATGAALQGLKKDFDAVAGSVPNSFGDTAKAISQVEVRTGQTGDAAQDLAKRFLELSNITETDLNANLKSGLQLFDTWGVAVGDQPRILNEFYRAAQASGGSVTDLLQKVGDADKVLQPFNFGIDESIALFASFERGGVDSGAALVSMTRALKTFSAEGIKDPRKALLQLLESIERTPFSAKVAQTAFKVFGKSGLELVDAAQEGRFNLDKLWDTIVNGQGDILEAAKNNRTFGESISQAFNQANIAIAQAVGPDALNSLATGIGYVAKAFAAAIKVFAAFPAPLQAAIVGSLALVAAIGPLTYYFGVLSTAGSVAFSYLAKWAASLATVEVATASASTELVLYNSGFATMQILAAESAASVAAQGTVWAAMGALVATAATVALGATVAFFGGALIAGGDFNLFLKGFLEFVQGAFAKGWQSSIDYISGIWNGFGDTFNSIAVYVGDLFISMLQTFGLGPEQIQAVVESMSKIWHAFVDDFFRGIQVVKTQFQSWTDDFRRGIGVVGQTFGAESWVKWSQQSLALAAAGRESAEAYNKLKTEFDKANTAANNLATGVKKIPPPPRPPPPPGLPDYLTDTKKAADEAAKAIDAIAKNLADSKATANIDKIKQSIDQLVSGVGDIPGLGSKADITGQLASLSATIREKMFADQKENLDKLSGIQKDNAIKVIDEASAYQYQKYVQDLAPKMLEVDRKNHQASVQFYQGLLEDVTSSESINWGERFKKVAIEVAAEWLARLVEANILASKSFSDLFDTLFSTLGDSLNAVLGKAVGGSGLGSIAGSIAGATGATAAPSIPVLLSGEAVQYGPPVAASAGGIGSFGGLSSAGIWTKAGAAMAVAFEAYIIKSNFDLLSGDFAGGNNVKDSKKAFDVGTAGLDTIFPGAGTAINKIFGGLLGGAKLTPNEQSLKTFEKAVEDTLEKAFGKSFNFVVGNLEQFADPKWADKFWGDFGDKGGEQFQALGTAFEKMFDLEKGVGQQIGALLAQNLSGNDLFASLDNIKLFLDGMGISVEQLNSALLDTAKAGNISWHEFDIFEQSLSKIPSEGLAAFGDVKGALDEVLTSGGKGIQAIEGLKNIAIEAGEAGITSFDGLNKYLLDAGYSADVVAALFQAFSQRGIASLDDLKNAADPALGGVIADMETLGVKWSDFTKATDDLNDGVKNLADSIRELSSTLKDIPDKIDTTVNVHTNGTAGDLTATGNARGAVLKFATGGIVNAPTLFPVANGGLGLMGEAGAEAIMPLAKVNGKLGVKATGVTGGGKSYNIYIDATGAKGGVEHDILAAMDMMSKQVMMNTMDAIAESKRRGS